MFPQLQIILKQMKKQKRNKEIEIIKKGTKWKLHNWENNGRNF